MSAQVLELDPHLQSAVNSQVISVAQAWALQDLMESSDSPVLEVPQDWLPWLGRLELFQVEPANDLPA
jgi:hypothetical protein